MSDVLQAIYRGDRAQAERLAAGKNLTVFEAAALGRTERLRELLDTDPSLVNAYGDDGFHPVGLACFFGHVDAARLLFERGADANQLARNEHIQTAAIHAAAAAGETGSAARFGQIRCDQTQDTAPQCGLIFFPRCTSLPNLIVPGLGWIGRSAAITILHQGLSIRHAWNGSSNVNASGKIPCSIRFQVTGAAMGKPFRARGE